MTMYSLHVSNRYKSPIKGGYMTIIKDIDIFRAYFRAPHIYIALPTRFVPTRGNSTEILFMSSRGGAPYERLFKEAFIRPGLAPERWGNRANYAALNVVPTSFGEMSIYHAGSGHRYILRTDGFVSVNAPFEGGEMITKPLRFR